MGHIDIVKRAAAIFDQLIVGIYDRPYKKLLFSVEERVAMVEEAIAELPNVRSMSYSGLTVDFIHKMKGTVMIRGLRANPDFEHEFAVALMNKKLASDIELICLMTSPQYQFLSSNLIKEVANLGGFVEDMVPHHVAMALKKKFSI